MWAAGCAGVAAVEYEPVVGDGAQLWGDVGLEIALHFEGTAAVGKPKAAGDSEDVGVDSYHGFAPEYGADHVGRLLPYPGKAHKLAAASGQLASELGADAPGQINQVLGFASRVGDGSYEGEEFCEAGRGKAHEIGISLEKGRGDCVDPLVCALGGEDDCHYQLVGRAEDQLRLRHGDLCLEVAEGLLVEAPALGLGDGREGSCRFAGSAGACLGRIRRA